MDPKRTLAVISPGLRTELYRRVRCDPTRTVASAVNIAVALLYLLPLIWILSLSVRTAGDIYGSAIVPHSFRLSNFRDAWNQIGLGPLYVNSVVLTVATVVLGLAVALPAAYGFARYRTRFGEAIFLLIVAELTVPAVAILLPFFLTMKYLGLYNHLVAVIIAETIFVLPFGIFVLRGYVERVPAELIDAARVDGASEWNVFRHVVLPLLKPATATVALFFALAAWNGFIMPLALIRDTTRSTLMVGLATFAADPLSTEWQMIAAAAVMASMPVIVIFIAARRYYVQGTTAGALRQ